MSIFFESAHFVAARFPTSPQERAFGLARALHKSPDKHTQRVPGQKTKQERKKVLRFLYNTNRAGWLGSDRLIQVYIDWICATRINLLVIISRVSSKIKFPSFLNFRFIVSSFQQVDVYVLCFDVSVISSLFDCYGGKLILVLLRKPVEHYLLS